MKKIKLILTYIIALFCVMFTLMNRPNDLEVLKTLTTHDDETVMIYMMNSERKLVPVTLYHRLSEEPQEQIIQLIQLMKQEFDIIDFVPLVPISLQCLSVNVENNLVYLNFNEAFYAMNKTIEMRVIEGIVSSVIQLNPAYNVAFEVNGELVEKMPISHVPMKVFDSTLGVNNFELITEGLHQSQSRQIVSLINNDEQNYYMITTVRLPSKMDDLEFVNKVISDISKHYEVLSLDYDDNIAVMKMNRALLTSENTIVNDVKSLLFTMKVNHMAEQFIIKIEDEIVNFHGTNENKITYSDLKLNTFEE